MIESLMIESLMIESLMIKSPKSLMIFIIKDGSFTKGF